jgi:hypothetical protein
MNQWSAYPQEALDAPTPAGNGGRRRAEAKKAVPRRRI